MKINVYLIWTIPHYKNIKEYFNHFFNKIKGKRKKIRLKKILFFFTEINIYGAIIIKPNKFSYSENWTQIFI